MQVMDLDAWLRTTDTVRKAHKLGDAWAQGNTDCAFRINDVTGVQRSHRANDWNYWGGDLAAVRLCACSVLYLASKRTLRAISECSLLPLLNANVVN